jgi:hypothetical protein
MLSVERRGFSPPASREDSQKRQYGSMVDNASGDPVFFAGSR